MITAQELCRYLVANYLRHGLGEVPVEVQIRTADGKVITGLPVEVIPLPSPQGATS